MAKENAMEIDTNLCQYKHEFHSKFVRRTFVSFSNQLINESVLNNRRQLRSFERLITIHEPKLSNKQTIDAILAPNLD